MGGLTPQLKSGVAMNNQYFMGGVQRGLSGVGPGTGLYGLSQMQGQQQYGGGSNTTQDNQQTASMPQTQETGLGGTPLQLPSYSGGGMPFWEIPTEALFPLASGGQGGQAGVQQSAQPMTQGQPLRPISWNNNYRTTQMASSPYMASTQYSFRGPNGGIVDEVKKRSMEENFRNFRI